MSDVSTIKLLGQNKLLVETTRLLNKSPFHFFIKVFLNETFCNLLLKIDMVSLIYQIFFINHC
jgi:hypothetical protein